MWKHAEKVGLMIVIKTYGNDDVLMKMTMMMMLMADVQ